jgi:DNA polymerase-4
LRHIRDVVAAPLLLLEQLAGSWAGQLQEFARGIDPRPVISDRGDAKSYGAQETFGDSTTDRAFVLSVLRGMADDLMSKVRRDRKAIRTVTMRVRYSEWRDASHGTTLRAATDLETDIYPLLPGLLRETWKEKGSLRLAGLRFSNIVEPAIQEELPLDTASSTRSKQQEVSRLLDTMRARNLPVVRAGRLIAERQTQRSD